MLRRDICSVIPPGQLFRPDRILMLSSSRLARACTPRTCTQRCLVTRASVSATDALFVDGEAISGQINSSAESAVDTVQLVSGDAPLAASSQLNGIVDRVKGISEDVYAGASSSVTVPSVDMSQFASYTEKASQLSADVMSKSAKVADQLSGAISEQLDAMPEYQAQLAAQFSTLRGVAEDALAEVTDASGSLSRNFLTEFVPRISSELQSFTQLAADGHYADAATSPAGIAAAGASVLLIGGIAASSSSSSSSPPSSPSSSTPALSPAENQASAEAWIAQWRAKNAPQLSSASAPSSSEDESSSSEETFNPAAASASSNGAFSSNGAAPAAEPTSRSMDMTIAEYVSGDASSEESSAGGWYVTSDSEAEDSPYSEVYAQSNGGGATATESVPDAAPAPAAAASAATSGSDSEDAADATEAAPAGAGTAIAAAEEAVVEIRYFSGWEAPTIHACAAGGEWGEHVMQRDAATGVLVWRGTLNTSAQPFESGAVAEFVITDGAGDWDKSPDGENYRVYECGTYDLRDGQLLRVE